MQLKEIKEHPLLDDDQRKVARALSKLSKREGKEFPALAFAEIALRAEAQNYAATSEDKISEVAFADLKLRRAALLYVYEALRATDLDIVREWSELDEALRSLEYLHGDLPEVS